MIDQKVALVTGSTSGIGRSIAISLAESGYKVIVCGLGSVDEIESCIGAIEKITTQRPIFLGTDFKNTSAVEAVLSELVESVGGIDILINNAGMQFISPIHEFPTEQWNDILALNLSACFHTTRLLLPKMLDKNFGRIINIASVHGLVASINKAAYISAKHGLIGLTKATALETAEKNITCNAVCPGWVDTPLIRNQAKLRAEAFNMKLEEGLNQLLGEKQPSKQFIDTSHIGALICFLCSDVAAQITGTSIPIDGGWIAQ